MNALSSPETIHRRRWGILAVLCISLFIAVVDNTIVNVALPTLSRDLNASTSQLQWIVDAYSLVFASLLLVGGSLGDRFGRKGALQLGLVLFSVCSLLAGLQTSAGALIVGRGLMGIGAALIFPATLAILTNVFTDPVERAKAIGSVECSCWTRSCVGADQRWDPPRTLLVGINLLGKPPDHGGGVLPRGPLGPGKQRHGDAPARLCRFCAVDLHDRAPGIHDDRSARAWMGERTDPWLLRPSGRCTGSFRQLGT